LNSLPKSNLLFLLFTFVVLAACNVSKKAQKSIDTAGLPTLSTDSLLHKLEQNQIDAEWLNAKARITFKDDVQTRKFTATIRLRKDSIIWMNVKKLSVEAARILIDKDSVYVIDRLNKEYYIKSLDYLAEQFHLPADFEALQTMILGNPYFVPRQAYEAKAHTSQYQLIGREEGGMFSDYWLDGQTFLLDQMTFLDLRYERKLEVFLEDYQPLNETIPFANKRIFKMLSEDTGNVKVIQ